MPVLSDITMTTHKDYKEVLFPVSLEKSEKLLEGFHFSNKLTNCVYAETKQKVLGFHGSDYRIIPNSEYFLPVIKRMGGMFGADSLSIKAQSYDDRSFFLTISVDTMIYEVMKDDEVCPMVTLRNSYDGSIKQSFSLSFFRKVCSNGLHAFAEEYEMQVRHSKSHTELPLDRLFNDLQKVETKIQRFKTMTERRMLPEELEALVSYVKQSKHLKFPKTHLDQVAEIATEESISLNQPINQWLVYNAFNNVLNHSKTRLFPNEKEKIDFNVLNTIEEFSEALN